MSKTNSSFLISKDLFIWHKKDVSEIYVVCQGWIQFLNVSKQLFPFLFKKKKAKSLIRET